MKKNKIKFPLNIPKENVPLGLNYSKEDISCKRCDTWMYFHIYNLYRYESSLTVFNDKGHVSSLTL